MLGMVSILDYEFKDSDRAFREAQLEFFALTSYSSIIEKALETGYISAEDMTVINQWHNSPADWKAAPIKMVRKKK